MPPTSPNGLRAARPVAKPAGRAAGQATAPAELTRVVGENLRRLRTRRGLSLERLSRACGVSRAMLGQVELAQSTPTIHVLWKISTALGVPFSALIAGAPEAQPAVMRARNAKLLASRDGAFTSRALFPTEGPRVVEFYELRLAPASVEKAEAHPPGTRENLVVAEGALTMVVGRARHQLSTGDAILFEADVAHEYRNEGPGELRMYLVITYADQLTPPVASRPRSV